MSTCFLRKSLNQIKTNKLLYIIFALLLVIVYLTSKLNANTNNRTNSHLIYNTPLSLISLYEPNQQNFYSIISYEHVAFATVGEDNYESSSKRIQSPSSSTTTSSSSPTVYSSNSDDGGSSKTAESKSNSDYNLAIVYDDKNETFEGMCA